MATTGRNRSAKLRILAVFEARPRCRLALAVLIAGLSSGVATSSNPGELWSASKVRQLSDVELGDVFLRTDPIAEKTSHDGALAEIRRRGTVPLRSIYEAKVSPACDGVFEPGFAKVRRSDVRITITRGQRVLDGVAVSHAILVHLPSEPKPMIGNIDDDRITLISRNGSCSIAFFAPTSLHEAVKSDDVETVARFIDEGADLDLSDFWGPPLCIAVRRGSTDVVKLLLDRGAGIETPTSAGSGGLHPLHVVASNRRGAHLAKLLIARGAELEARDGAGRTPLIAAVDADNEAVADVLLRAGADPDTSDSLQGRSPMIWAAAWGRLAVARLLLEAGVDVNRRAGPDGDMPLHIAVGHDRIQIVPLLVRYGADVNAVNNRNQTPLHGASNETMRHLLRNLGARD